jgi:hypothetical protein
MLKTGHKYGFRVSYPPLWFEKVFNITPAVINVLKNVQIGIIPTNGDRQA